MEMINYIVSLLVFVLAVGIKIRSILLDDSTLFSKNISTNTILLGAIIVGSLTLIIAFNLRFLGFHRLADFTFLLIFPLGIFITIKRAFKGIQQD